MQSSIHNNEGKKTAVGASVVGDAAVRRVEKQHETEQSRLREAGTRGSGIWRREVRRTRDKRNASDVLLLD